MPTKHRALSAMSQTGLILRLVGGLLVWPGSAHAQATIKVSDDVSLGIGVLLQGWANFEQLPPSDSYTQEIFLRRARFLLGGQVAKGVTFFFQIDAANLGRSTKGAKAFGTLAVRDAFMSVEHTKNQFLDAGLILVPTSRTVLLGSATLLPLDYGTTDFLSSGVTNSGSGRDLGA